MDTISAIECVYFCMILSVVKDAVASSRWILVTDIVQAHSTRPLVLVDTLES